MKNILYIGIFSTTNIGDLVISNEMYRYLKSKDNYSVEVMDFFTLKKINSSNINVSINLNNNIITNFKNLLSKCNMIRYSYLKHLQLSASNESNNMYDEYKSIIDRFDLICIGGGNLIMSIADDIWAIKINTLVKIAKSKNKKVYIMSVGVGPILSSKSKKLYKETIETVDFITVRDEFSKCLLENDLCIGKEIKVTGDPALLLKDYAIKRNKCSQNNVNVAISIMPFGSSSFLNLPEYNNYTYYKNMYKNLIEHFCKMNNNCILSLFSTEFSDYKAITDIYKHVLGTSKIISEKNLKIVYIRNLSDLLEFYGTQDLLIGTRMHSLIIGYTQSLPIIAISWQKKVNGFMAYVNLVPFCYELNTVNENLCSIYADASNLLSGVEQNNKKEITSIRESFDYISTSYISQA